MITEAVSSAPRVVWQPLPGSQALAMCCPANLIVYHGTRGPGKTDAQLMFYRKHVGLGYGHFWKGIILDREYKNLDDLVTKSRRWFPQFNDGAKWLTSKSDYKWIWPTGEELLFRHGCKEADYDAFHGHEYPYIGFNELTKQSNRKFFDAIQSCNRSGFLPVEHTPRNKDGTYATADGQPLPEIPLVCFATTNPYGAGHNWVKNGIIDKSRPGEIHKIVSRVFNPRTKQKEDVTRTQCHLFGSYRENRYLSPVYIAKLDAEKDPNKRKAWLEGDWNIVAGGAIDDVWNESVHVLPRFKIPKEWRVDRSFDWGSTQPFSCGWWAEANGEEVTLPDGRIFCPKAGSLIRLAEYYGTAEVGTNEGLKMAASKVAQNILEHERRLIAQKWITEEPRSGPADNAIKSVPEKESESIAKKMADWGVRWTDSDKKAGSRINGLELVRGMLTAALHGEEPGLYVMANCKAFISTVPVLPRDPDKPDDVDTEAEDHIYDETRYRVLAGGIRAATSIKVSYPS